MLVVVDELDSRKIQLLSVEEYHEAENVGELRLHVLVLMLAFKVGKLVPQADRFSNFPSVFFRDREPSNRWIDKAFQGLGQRYGFGSLVH
ncbi:hypothetical protein D3C87_1629370 [compost metagenome]